MADLSVVKKEIISLINIYPGGIAADKFNHEYQSLVGKAIPFGDFLYVSLLAFLGEELKENIKIEYNGMNVLLYPIGSEKSAHILKMTEVQNASKKTKHSPRRSNSSYQNNAKASSSCNAKAVQTAPQAKSSRQRSPTMPRLVEYKAFRNTNNGSLSRQHEQKMVKERLLQSQQRHLMHQQELATGVPAQQRSSPNSSTNRNAHKSNDTVPSSGRRPSLSSQLEKIEIKIEAKKEQLANNSRKESQSSEPSSQPSASKPMNESPVFESLQENLWDDELDFLQPPTAPAKSKANSNGSSLYYGVSDIEGDSSAPPSSGEMMRRTLAEHIFSDEEEEEEQNEIKAIVSELHPGDTIPVRLSEVNSPLKFWVHVRQEKYMNEIDTLYKEMQEYYKKNQSRADLKVTDPDEPNSQYFATNAWGNWQRVEPLDTRMGESLRVSLIDYGSCEIINISQLRKLPKQFWKTPKAALCCALANIRPTGKEFTAASADALVDLADGQKMFAKILRIDNIKSKANVELILDSTKVCVNDEIIRLGHAVPKKVRSSA